MSEPSTRPVNSYSIEEAYAYCRELAQQHYENFPVASRLLPEHTRDAVAVIYAFARQADDFADEGDHEPQTRLELLDSYTERLEAIADRHEAKDDPVFIALADVIAQHALPLQLFHDLLSAFRQDVTKTRYANFGEIMDYCRRSANPVGRLLLHLQHKDCEENLELSDKVCSALQIINFLQDIEQDYRENNRIYLPQDEMERFDVSETDIAQGKGDTALQQLFEQQLARALHMMREGALLGTRLNGRFGLEIRLIIEAGLCVCEKLANHNGDVFARPRLARMDYLKIIWRALQRHRHLSAPATPSSFSGNR